MKKVLTIIAVLLAVTLTGVMLVGCIDQGDYNYDIPSEIVVGYDNHFPPMGYKDEDLGMDVGFDLDLARAVGEVLGVKMTLKAITWSNKETDLNNGSIDLIWNGYTMSDERMKHVDFSIPYMKNAQVAVVQAGSAYQALTDLSGVQLLIQLGSTANDSYLKYDYLKDNKVNKHEDNVMCFTELQVNPNSAIVTDKVLAEHMMARPGFAGKFRLIEQELEPERYAVGIRRKDVGLRIKLNDALITLKENGKLLEIANKWGLADALLI